MANPIVAADVNPLIIPAGEKLELTHVGCYRIPNAALATDSFPELGLGRTIGGMNFVWTPAPTSYRLPQERK